MKNMIPVAVLFVSREDYAEFRRVCVDGQSLPSDYDTWLKLTTKFFDDIESQGIVSARIYIKPQELVDWCISNKRMIDTNARKEYAAWRVHNYKG